MIRVVQLVLAAMLLLAPLLAGPLLNTSAFAVEPSEVLADPALEGRARAISADLRCLVCQNQSIDDSHSDFARDLRQVVREQLTAGASDAQVRAFVVERYGEFILLKPRFAADTLALWVAPCAVLALGALIAWRAARKRGPATIAPLDPEEARRLEALLKARGGEGA